MYNPKPIFITFQIGDGQKSHQENIKLLEFQGPTGP